jgi:hypothetical protein
MDLARRVSFKGIDTAVKRLADASTRTYHYAWHGGPRLEGVPGSAEFVASYNEAIAKLPNRRNGIVTFTQYRRSLGTFCPTA